VGIQFPDAPRPKQVKFFNLFPTERFSAFPCASSAKTGGADKSLCAGRNNRNSYAENNAKTLMGERQQNRYNRSASAKVGQISNLSKSRTDMQSVAK
jgi:hypothetical protein